MLFFAGFIIGVFIGMIFLSLCKFCSDNSNDEFKKEFDN